MTTSVKRSCKTHYKIHFNYGLSCNLRSILVSKEPPPPHPPRLIIHTRASEGGLETLFNTWSNRKRLTLRINVNIKRTLLYVLFHVVQTNIKYLCTDSCNVRRKPSICVMYLYLLINKTQTQLKIYWRSEHLDCIKTNAQSTNNIKLNYKLVHFTTLCFTIYIFNCQNSLESINQSIKDIIKITNWFVHILLYFI